MKTLKDGWLNRPRPQSANPAGSEAPQPQAADDIDFKVLFADVTPLKKESRVHHPRSRPSSHPKKRPQQHAYPSMHHPVGWFEPAHPACQFIRSGMQNNTLKRLRAGHWAVCAELDLHGLDRYAAQDQLAVFIFHARQRGQCVRIIHGRGLGSHGEPILKKTTRNWLSHHPDILAWCETHEGGALLVLLRQLRD